MIVLASFVCGKVSKKKGEEISLEEIKLLGGNTEHLISQGCLERLVTKAEAAEIMQEMEIEVPKKKKGK